jgi:hypothetical protein
MKYYLGKIEERNGGMEYSDKYLFVTTKNPDKYAEKVAMTWRGGDKSDYDADQDGYWSDSTLIFDHGATEIPKEDFDVLRKYIPVL